MIERNFEERTLTLNRNLLTIKSLIRRQNQDALEKDIIITNLYEPCVENLTYLVYRVAHVLGVYLTIYDIVSVERLGSRRFEEASPLLLKPRPVAARLSTRRLAEEMVQRSRVLRNLNNEHLDLPGPRRRVVVHERLTRYFEHLYKELRSTGRQQGYKYIWRKRGHLYVRRTDNHPAQEVRSWEEFHSMFPNSVDVESVD
ncbi:hypothetical protein B5X24_HaOG207121 [Helicoverpa armigera]|uniref:FP protein C-terminal domain-containing protein n=1 Tax=Helicoverpa armigera TaxID=29058 RepID=A0A2W1BNK2_HELAM|nr:hypothetical protein B5X24_HaOG207121 [Helicoverpa armigera]